MKRYRASSCHRQLTVPEPVLARRENAAHVCAVLLALAGVALCLGPAASEAALVVTEVMSESLHPGETTPGTGTANGDWWELTNTGPSAVNLGGHSWADSNHQAGETLFPPVLLTSGESVLIVNENLENIEGFRTAWGLPIDVVTLSKDAFTGIEGFHRFDPDGDEVNLYDLDDVLVTMVSFGVANLGVTFEWARGGESLGTSVAGEYGAYVAPGNGSGGPGLDIGSPGISVKKWLGDVNRDGLVNGLDVDPFVARVLDGPYQEEADMNLDGFVNGLDVDPFVDAVVLGGGAMAVPEPSTWALIGFAAAFVGLFGGVRRVRRLA